MKLKGHDKLSVCDSVKLTVMFLLPEALLKKSVEEIYITHAHACYPHANKKHLQRMDETAKIIDFYLYKKPQTLAKKNTSMQIVRHI